MTVIEIKETSKWFDANLLKASIEWMKRQNNPMFRKAIEDEEELLRNFFRQVRSQGEAASLSSAA